MRRQFIAFWLVVLTCSGFFLCLLAYLLHWPSIRFIRVPVWDWSPIPVWSEDAPPQKARQDQAAA